MNGFAVIFLLILQFNYRIENNWGFYYNSNIFKMSSQEISEFKTGLYSFKFPYKSLDDLVIDANFKFYLSFLQKAKRSVQLGSNVTVNHFVNNPIKDYISLGSNFDFRISKINLNISTIYLPEHLIRYYRPVNSNTYKPCMFQRKRLSFEITYTTEKLRWSNQIGYWIDKYNQEFSYYDSRNLGANFALSHKLFEEYMYFLEYSFVNSSAKGPIPDISHTDHRINFDFSFLPGKHRIRRTSFYGSLTYRLYKSENPPQLDYIHAGRYEFYYNVGIKAQIRVSYGIYSTITLERSWRNSYSSVYSDIGNLKNYSAFKIGANFNFRT
ncbi:MAG: hypothetical protein ACPLN0_00905 [Candidatus Hydrothermia bacterium]